LHAGGGATWLAKLGVVFTPAGGHDFLMNFVWVAALLPVVFLAPNTQQIMQRFQPALNYRAAGNRARLTWSAQRRWAIAMAFVLARGLLSLTRPSEFLYFQF
jgi:alginate O-acetyltransferase complex protein AlgI